MATEAMGQFSCLLPIILSISTAFMTINALELSALNGKVVNTQVFSSPPFYLSPGAVSNKYYYGIDFPRGHLALKSFNAEVVDEKGTPVPLYETYLHHWLVIRYFSPIGSDPAHPEGIVAKNSGPCDALDQYYGLGSETRRTLTWVPDPYGIEIGKPKQIPQGYEEKWVLNVHAIDTRGVVDKLKCTECRCNLYNVTTAESGQPLPKDYIGGLLCCADQTQCQLKKNFTGVTRKLYLRYTVKWMDWNKHIVPVKIYIFDVTYTLKASNSSGSHSSSCKIEYDVKACSLNKLLNSSCVDSKRTYVPMRRGGKIIYAVAHQHAGGVGSALYGQNGRVLCKSIPHYGTGNEAGNELGYVVGMSTCYPRPGSTRINDGEILMLESNYSSSQMHTGVMGLFYVLVAEKTPKS